MSQVKFLKQVYESVREVGCSNALQMVREATSEEERDFFAFVANMNLQRTRWDYMRNERELYKNGRITTSITRRTKYAKEKTLL